MTTELTANARPDTADVAHRLHDVDEVLSTARELTRQVAAGASDRDHHRVLPTLALDELSRSGLLAITVPAAYGGIEVPVAVLAEVVRLLATADASVAQIPQPHFTFLDALRRLGTPAQQERFFARVLAGERFANAQVERSSATVTQDATTLRRQDDGTLVLEGTKYYATGSLFAHVLVVRAVDGDVDGGDRPDGARPKVLVYLDAHAPGVRIDDDWNGLGQRTTASGTVHLDRVLVAADQVVAHDPLFDERSTYGARAQVLHAAIDTGLARGALDAGVAAAGRARPWFEAGVEHAEDDPLLIQVAGQLEVVVRSAEALLDRAARCIDAAEADPTDRLLVDASIATAVAKVAASQAATEVASRVFELGGTRAAAADLNLARFWRDARTHTLHDPERWKLQHIGRWTLSTTPPPRHGQI